MIAMRSQKYICPEFRRSIGRGTQNDRPYASGQQPSLTTILYLVLNAHEESQKETSVGLGNPRPIHLIDLGSNLRYEYMAFSILLIGEDHLPSQGLCMYVYGRYHSHHRIVPVCPVNEALNFRDIDHSKEELMCDYERTHQTLRTFPYVSVIRVPEYKIVDLS
jgi:hypothetical protein